MSAIVDALLAELTDGDLDRLAERLAPRLTPVTASADNGWLDVAAAAAYLACPRSRIYKLSSTGRMPCHRDGSRLLFKRAELDTFVRNGGARQP